MKLLLAIFVLAAVLVAGCSQQESVVTRAIPNNSVMLNEEKTNLYDGSCTTGNLGTCETKTLEWVKNLNNTEAFNSSFNYSIFLQKPFITKFYKYVYKYALMDGNRVVISEGYENSNNDTLTVNEVLCSHHVALVVSCPIPDNTTFKLVNVTRSNVNTSVPVVNAWEAPAGTYDTSVNSIIDIKVTSPNDEVLYLGTCDLSQADSCTLPLNASVASKITSSKIELKISNANGSLIENASETIGISGVGYFPKCRLVITNNSEECIPV